MKVKQKLSSLKIPRGQIVAAKQEEGDLAAKQTNGHDQLHDLHGMDLIYQKSMGSDRCFQ